MNLKYVTERGIPYLISDFSVKLFSDSDAEESFLARSKQDDVKRFNLTTTTH